MVPEVKNLPVNAGDVRDLGSGRSLGQEDPWFTKIPGSGRSAGGGHGNPLQYFCQENPMDRGAWQVTVHRIPQSQI